MQSWPPERIYLVNQRGNIKNWALHFLAASALAAILAACAPADSPPDPALVEAATTEGDGRCPTISDGYRNLVLTIEGGARLN